MTVSALPARLTFEPDGLRYVLTAPVSDRLALS